MRIWSHTDGGRSMVRAMAGQYGMSQTALLIQQGKYEAAIEEATREIAKEEKEPAHFLERAQALAILDRHAEAVADLETAIRLDEDEVLDADRVDDEYFSALLGVAKKEAAASVAAGVARLGRYREILPEGSHKKDAEDWQKRLRGELKSEFVKQRNEPEA